MAELSRACPQGRCDGSGWLLDEHDLAHPCPCREPRIERRRARGVSSRIPERFRGVSFDRPPVSFGIDPTAVDAVRRYCDALAARLAEGQGLWMMGPPGTGKTTLAMLVSTRALQEGHTVAIYSLPSLLARIRRTYDAAPHEDDYVAFFRRLSSVDLLHLDDVGTEKRSDWVLEQLYALINDRYEQRRSVMVTTNLEPHELEEQIGPRTVSRLVEMCGDALRLEGDDARLAHPGGRGPLADAGWSLSQHP